MQSAQCDYWTVWYSCYSTGVEESPESSNVSLECSIVKPGMIDVMYWKQRSWSPTYWSTGGVGVVHKVMEANSKCIMVMQFQCSTG